jgi:hypothetical protein
LKAVPVTSNERLGFSHPCQGAKNNGKYAARVAVTMAAGPLIIAAGAILPLVGKAALEVVKSRVELDDVKRGASSEVAFIHELRGLA